MGFPLHYVPFPQSPRHHRFSVTLALQAISLNETDAHDTPHMYLQFQDDAHHLLVLERIVQLGDEMVLQSVHYIHLALHIPAVAPVGDAHKLGRQLQAGRLLPALVDRSEFAPVSESQR